MAVITISRKLGSRGDYIAEKVAQVLDYHYVDKEFIGRVLSQYGLIEFDKEYDNLPGFWEKFNSQKEERRELMVDMLNRVMRAVAHHGNVVILGRSGFSVFQGFGDVLNARIQAPFSFRVTRVMEQEEITYEEADALVKQDDRVRSTFVKSFYGVQWDAPNAFDLLIDTGKISPELAIRWLVEAIRELEKREAGDKLTTASIQVDSVLAETISTELQREVADKQSVDMTLEPI